jgi:NAD(P)-dependent dehydrogenase (short-subunit alcohol dehydrogenase family)
VPRHPRAAERTRLLALSKPPLGSAVAFQGQAAIVTGGAKGIGQDIAERLAQAAVAIARRGRRERRIGRRADPHARRARHRGPCRQPFPHAERTAKAAEGA